MRATDRSPESNVAGRAAAIDRRSRATVVRGAVIFAALAIVSVVLVSRSSAAFTASTDTSGSSFSSGNVDLVDNDQGAALITVADMKPGQTVTDCIVVTYQGSIPDPLGVKLYSGGYADTGTFADHLLLTVDEGNGGTVDDCTGFVSDGPIVTNQALSAFDGAATDYASGVGDVGPLGHAAVEDLPDQRAARSEHAHRPAGRDGGQRHAGLGSPELSTRRGPGPPTGVRPRLHAATSASSPGPSASRWWLR